MVEMIPEKDIVQIVLKMMQDKQEDFVVRVVNRLDKDTSGIIVFTKNRPANKIISETFQNHNLIFDLLTPTELS